MASSVRRTNPSNQTLTRFKFGLLGLVAALAFGGCEALETGLKPREQLDCDPAPLAGTYLMQAEGEYTRDELAARADDPDRRGEQLDDLGFEAGTFSAWRFRDEDPDPRDSGRVNLVCQVAFFEDEDGARAFVAALEPSAASLAAASLAWPANAGDIGNIEQTRNHEHLRGFVAQPAGEDGVGLSAMFLAEGRQVLAVQLGGRGVIREDGNLQEVVESFAFPEDD